ncbi:MAG: hypothetical protein ACK4FU_03205 [Fervidobacterium gondwanense]|uniref:hypothetical protein n=1 Tax=Fervidobacterium gondwanense TaxID=44754 RepID=UPI00393FCE22
MLLHNLYIRIMKSDSGKRLLKELCDTLGLPHLKADLDSITEKQIYTVAESIATEANRFFEKHLPGYHKYSYLYNLLDLSIPTLGKQLERIVPTDLDLFYAVYLLKSSNCLADLSKFRYMSNIEDSMKDFASLIKTKSDKDLADILRYVIINGEIWKLYMETIEDEMKSDFEQKYNKVKQTVNNMMNRSSISGSVGRVYQHNYGSSGRNKSSKSSVLILTAVVFVAVLLVLLIALFSRKPAPEKQEEIVSPATDTTIDVATNTSIEASPSENLEEQITPEASITIPETSVVNESTSLESESTTIEATPIAKSESGMIRLDVNQSQPVETNEAVKQDSKTENEK